MADALRRRLRRLLGHSGSSDDRYNPVVTPVATTAAPEASPAADSEAERWITDPATATCETDPANPPGAVDGDWVGFAPLAEPLPFSETSPINQTAAAEVYLQFRTCQTDAVVTDLLISDTFAQFVAAESGDVPPEHQAQTILLGQRISEWYADRDPMSYVIEGDPLPGDASSPDSFTGQSRRVLLPDDIVQLADGRIGGPAHVFVRTNNPSGAAQLPGLPESLETAFVIFTAENGRWVIDDYLPICLGDCDAYWTSFAERSDLPATAVTIPAATPAAITATPEASPAADSAGGADLLAGESCAVPARSAEDVAAFKLDPGPRPAANYGVIGPAEPVAASEALVAANMTMRCDDRTLARDTSGLESPRYIALPSEAVFGGKIDTDAYLGSLDEMQALSGNVLSADWTASMREWTSSPPPGIFTGVELTAGSRMWAEPDQMVELADGRIGVPMTMSIPPGLLDVERERRFMIVPFRILTRDESLGGRWVLDQVVPLCSGDCAAYWTMVAAEPDVLGRLSQSPLLDQEGKAADATTVTSVAGGPTCLSEPAPAILQPATQPPYAYTPTGTITRDQAAALSPLMRTFASCMYGPDLTGITATGTDRFSAELEQALDPATTVDPALTSRVRALRTEWTQPLTSGTNDLRQLWLPSDTNPAHLTVFMSSARTLPDGRIGVLATIASASVSPIPDETWARQTTSAIHTVLFLGIVDTGQGLLVDEAFNLCTDASCAPFGASGAASAGPLPPEGTPPATLSARERSRRAA